MTRVAVRRATILGWTGSGSQADLVSSVAGSLAAAGVRARVRRCGPALIVEGPEPASSAAALVNTPGVAWVAIGMSVKSFKELADASRLLARSYIRPGSRFMVAASAGKGVMASDVSGTVTSAVLETRKGARIDEQRPQIVIRATLSDEGGAAAVETSRGPGGTPTGRRWVTCLASGGIHSSVLCWMALLSGYRLRMVHAKADDASLLAVAKLYAELSHRVDPSFVDLEVVVGTRGDPMALWAGLHGIKPVFAGFHAGCSDVPRMMTGKVGAPLYLAQEEWLETEAASLLTKPHLSLTDWHGSAAPPVQKLGFGGTRADVSGVLDGLRKRRSPGS